MALMLWKKALPPIGPVTVSVTACALETSSTKNALYVTSARNLYLLMLPGPILTHVGIISYKYLS
jgi:hypothetical protein